MRRTHSTPTQITIKRKWTDEEDTLLRDLVNELGQTPEAWKTIAESFPHRNTKQCRERYLHHLNPEVDKSPWSVEEEKLLFQLQATVGNSWTDISHYLPGRSEAAVKNRYYSALRRVERAHHVPGSVAAELLSNYARKSMVNADRDRLEILREEINHAQNARKGSSSSSSVSMEESTHPNLSIGSIHGSIHGSNQTPPTTISTVSTNHRSASVALPTSSSSYAAGTTTNTHSLGGKGTIPSTITTTTASNGPSSSLASSSVKKYPSSTATIPTGIPSSSSSTSTIAPNHPSLDNDHFANILFDISHTFDGFMTGGSLLPTNDSTTTVDTSFSPKSVLLTITPRGRKISMRVNLPSDETIGPANTITVPSTVSTTSTSLTTGGTPNPPTTTISNHTLVHSIVQELIDHPIDNYAMMKYVPEGIDTTVSSLTSSSSTVTPASTVSTASTRSSAYTPSPSNSTKHEDQQQRITKRLQFADAVIKSPLSTSSLKGSKGSTPTSTKQTKRKRTIQSLTEKISTSVGTIATASATSTNTSTTPNTTSLAVADGNMVLTSMMNDTTDPRTVKKQKSFPYASLSAVTMPTTTPTAIGSFANDGGKFVYPVADVSTTIDERIASSVLWDNDTNEPMGDGMVDDENNGEEGEEIDHDNAEAESAQFNQRRMYASYLTGSTPVQPDDGGYQRSHHYHPSHYHPTIAPHQPSPFSHSSSSQSYPYLYGHGGPTVSSTSTKPSTLLRLQPVVSGNAMISSIIPPFTPIDNTGSSGTNLYYTSTGLDSSVSSSQATTVPHTGPLFVRPETDTSSPFVPRVPTAKERNPTSVRLTNTPSVVSSTVTEPTAHNTKPEVSRTSTVPKGVRNMTAVSRWDITSPSASMTSAGFGFGLGRSNDDTTIHTNKIGNEIPELGTVRSSVGNDSSTVTVNANTQEPQSSEPIVSSIGVARNNAVSSSRSPRITPPQPQIQTIPHTSFGASFVSPMHHRSYNNVLASPVPKHTLYPSSIPNTIGYVSTPLGMYPSRSSSTSNNGKHSIFSPDHYRYSSATTFPYPNNYYYPSSVVTPPTRLTSTSSSLSYPFLPTAPVSTESHPSLPYRTNSNSNILPSLPLHLLNTAGNTGSTVTELQSMTNHSSMLIDGNTNTSTLSPYSHNPPVTAGTSSTSTYVLPIDVPLIHSHRSNNTTDSVSHLSDLSFHNHPQSDDTHNTVITPRTDT